MQSQTHQTRRQQHWNQDSQHNNARSPSGAQRDGQTSVEYTNTGMSGPQATKIQRLSGPRHIKHGNRGLQDQQRTMDTSCRRVLTRIQQLQGAAHAGTAGSGTISKSLPEMSAAQMEGEETGWTPKQLLSLVWQAASACQAELTGDPDLPTTRWGAKPHRNWKCNTPAAPEAR